MIQNNQFLPANTKYSLVISLRTNLVFGFNPNQSLHLTLYFHNVSAPTKGLFPTIDKALRYAPACTLNLSLNWQSNSAKSFAFPMAISFIVRV